MGNTNFDLNRRASLRPYLREAGGEIPSAYSPGTLAVSVHISSGDLNAAPPRSLWCRVLGAPEGASLPAINRHRRRRHRDQRGKIWVTSVG
jgi:hypothetical protein